MIVTANKYVNARAGKPFRDAPNPFFLKPGDQIEIEKRIYGESVEGSNIWYLGKDGNLYTSKGFINDKMDEVPITNNSSLFEEWRINDAWKITKGKGIRIAIIDGGFDMSNKAITNNDNQIIGEIKNDYHGTYMASIISGSDYMGGYLGLVPEATIFYSCIDIENFKQEDLYNCLLGLPNMDIISMSFSRFHTDFENPVLNMKLLNLISQMRNDYNTVFVASTGNEGNKIKRYPAAYKETVLSVSGQSSKLNEVDGNSSMWDAVSLIAPYIGYFDKSNSFQKDFQFPTTVNVNGTSSSTAFVAGILSIIKNIHYIKNQKKITQSEVIEKYLEQVSVLFTGSSGTTYSCKTNIIKKSEFLNLLK